jgi:hypothetical protein
MSTMRRPTPARPFREASDTGAEVASTSEDAVSKWRMKDRMKTMSVALILCLNIGVDPPDVLKISPCARMQCWQGGNSTTGPVHHARRLSHRYSTTWQA